jgi:coenzyme F420-0:L-glutamate ligase/coenzyme F420-1:gamma-L-glutamate ligase
MLPSEALHAFLRSRRSVRRFLPEPVPEAVVQRILETAIYAPSAHNLQPWQFVWLREATLKRRLADALTRQMEADMRGRGAEEEAIAARVARSRRRMDEAPLVVVLNLDNAIRRDPTDPWEHHMLVQSVAMVGLQMLLAAHAEGLGGVWVCWPLYAQEATRRALNLPSTWEPQGMLFLGYPAEALLPPPRRAP